MLNNQSKISIIITFILFFSCCVFLISESGIYDKIGVISEHGFHGAVPEENIDLFTGNLTLKYLDVNLPGPNGFDLKIWRVYNSKILRDRFPADAWGIQQEPYSWVGMGWSMHMGRLHDFLTTTPTIEFPDGRMETAYLEKNGTYYYTRDFLKYDNNNYKLYFKNGTVWTFGLICNINYESGQKSVRLVTKIENSYGHQINITYKSGSPVIQKIVDSMGREVNFYVTSETNPKLQYIRVKNAHGNNADYNYTVSAPSAWGGRYRLDEFDPPLLNSATYSYYDGSSSKFELTGVNTCYGGIIEYEYSNHNFYLYNTVLETRVVIQKKVKFSSSQQNFDIWNYSYPSYNNVSEGTVTITGPEYTTKVTYNCYNNVPNDGWKIGLIKKKWFPDDSSYSEVYEWEPQSLSYTHWVVLSTDLGEATAPLINSLIKERAGDNDSKEEYIYETSIKKYGLPRNIKSYVKSGSSYVLKNKIEFEYFYESNSVYANNYILIPLKKEIQYSSNNTKLKETETSYYTTTGNLGAIDWVKRWKESSTYRTWDYTYTSSNPNSITIKINPPGSLSGEETYKYSYGILSEVKRPGFTELTRTISQHDSSILSETNQHGGQMNFTYDLLGRITGITLSSMGFNNVSAVWSYNNVVIQQDQNKMTKYWDGMGRDLGFEEEGDGIKLYFRKYLSSEGRVESESKGSTNTLDRYSYLYNNAGQVTKITDPLNKITVITYSGYTKTVKDPLNNSNEYEFAHLPGLATKLKDPTNKSALYTYDDIGRLIQVKYNNARTQIYSYDGLDNVLSETHPETGIINYTYNSENNLSSKSWGGATTSYTYNSSNQVTNSASGDETITYTYDTKGRISAVSSNKNWGRSNISYNLLGSITGETQSIPGLTAKSLSYEYDGNNILDKITYPNGNYVSYTNNGLNMPETVSFNSGGTQNIITQSSYGIQKKPTLLKFGNNTQYTASYNSIGAFTEVALKKSSLPYTTFYDADYTYDDVGNIKTISGSNPNVNISLSYTDDLYRLTYADYSINSVHTIYYYYYDQYGNMTQAKRNGATIFQKSYTNKNQISGYSYDNRGNLTQDNKYKYIWDNQNRLKEIQNLTSSTLGEYLYNESGLRLKATREPRPTLAPEINIRQGDTDISDEGFYNFGYCLVGTNTNVTFTIENLGISPLTISGTPVISIKGRDMDEFSVQQQPQDTTLEQGESTTFIIRFSPISEGYKRVWISIANNDSDENPYGVIFAGDGYTTQAYSRETYGPVVNDEGDSLGCSWADYDNDGDLDLFVANVDQNYLYENNGDGSFSRVIDSDIVTDFGITTGNSWGDYDNDGFIDLITNSGFDVLYRNVPGKKFIPDMSKVKHVQRGNSTTSSWADYDNDGDLDLFITNNGNQNNILLQNKGDGTFTAVRSCSIVTDGGSSYGCSWADFDNDGDLDLFVANRNNQRNFLYNNNGEGIFERILFGEAANDRNDTTGGSWGDYDNDGDLDLFVTNFYDQNNCLYQNTGNGYFIKIQDSIVSSDKGYSTGSCWGDYDNDGDLDLFVANFGQKNFMYQNNGDGTFVKVESGALVEAQANSMSCSWADFDRDGHLDLFVANSGDQNNDLFISLGNDNGWINLELKGRLSNASAIGAKVRLLAYLEGIPVWQTREISAQTGLNAQDSLNVEFGLKDASIIDEIRLEWPSGHVQVLRKININQFLTIIETDTDSQNDHYSQYLRKQAFQNRIIRIDELLFHENMHGPFDLYQEFPIENYSNIQEAAPTELINDTLITAPAAAPVSTYYIYSFDGLLLAEYNNSGSCVKEYIYSAGQLIAEYLPQEGKYYFYTSDQINSTRVVMDINGTKVFSSVYDAYGGVLNTSPYDYDPVLKFSGKERDHESELDYFGARYYDHTHSRFINTDPIINKEEAISNPQLWNLYSYCRNNPVTYLDPDGRVLVPATLRGHQPTYLDHEVLDMYNKFVEACEAIGVDITSSRSDPIGGFRTTEQQKEERRKNKNTSTGPSLHESGHAFDVDWSKIPEEKREQVEEIAKKVGLSQGDWFGEPWHFYKEVPGGRKNRPKYIKEAQGIYQRSEEQKRWRDIKG